MPMHFDEPDDENIDYCDYIQMDEDGNWYMPEDAPEAAKRQFEEEQKMIEEFTARGELIFM